MFNSRPKFIKWLFYSLLSIISIVLVLFILIVLKFFSGDYIGRGSGPESLTIQPASLGLNSETVRFPARDGLRIEGWMLSADPPGKAIIILSHGGGSNRSNMLGRATSLINGGYDVLAIDLRAHGGSEGELNSLGMMEALDILGAMDYLKTRGEKRPIVLMGLSLGSVSSINAASQSTEAVAVIAEGSFKSYRDPIRIFAEYSLQDTGISFLNRVQNTIVDWPSVDFMTRLEIWFHAGIFIDPDNTDAIRSVKKIEHTPILFLTGEHDFMKPELHALVMLEVSNSSLSEIRIIKGGGHSAYNDETAAAYNEAVFGFLDKVLNEQSGSRQSLEQTRIILRQALLDGDIDILERIWANNYVLTTRTGKILTKSHRIESIRSGKLSYLEADESDLQFYMYGNTAIVTGVGATITNREGREIISGKKRFTEVYMHREGSWQMIARHASVVEK